MKLRLPQALLTAFATVATAALPLATTVGTGALVMSSSSAYADGETVTIPTIEQYLGTVYTWNNTYKGTDMAFGRYIETTYADGAFTVNTDNVLQNWNNESGHANSTGNQSSYLTFVRFANGGSTVNVSNTETLSTLRFAADTYGQSTKALSYTFTPLVLGGLIVEQGATGYSITSSGEKERSFWLGGSSSQTAYSLIQENFSINNTSSTNTNNLLGLRGTQTIYLDNSATLTLNSKNYQVYGNLTLDGKGTVAFTNTTKAALIQANIVLNQQAALSFSGAINLDMTGRSSASEAFIKNNGSGTVSVGGAINISNYDGLYNGTYKLLENGSDDLGTKLQTAIAGMASTHNRTFTYQNDGGVMSLVIADEDEIEITANKTWGAWVDRHVTSAVKVLGGTLSIGDNGAHNDFERQTFKYGRSITVDDGATLNVQLWAQGGSSKRTILSTDKVVFDTAITLQGGANMKTTDGSYYFKGGVVVDGNATITHSYGKGLVYGAITGGDNANASTTLTFAHASGESAVVSFGEEGTFGGTVELQKGSTQEYVINHSNALQNANVNLAGSPNLRLNVAEATVAALSGSGTVMLNGNNYGETAAPTASTLTITGHATGRQVFSGTIGSGVTVEVAKDAQQNFMDLTLESGAGLTLKGDILLNRTTLNGGLTIDTTGTVSMIGSVCIGKTIVNNGSLTITATMVNPASAEGLGEGTSFGIAATDGRLSTTGNGYDASVYTVVTGTGTLSVSHSVADDNHHYYVEGNELKYVHFAGNCYNVNVDEKYSEGDVANVSSGSILVKNGAVLTLDSSLDSHVALSTEETGVVALEGTVSSLGSGAMGDIKNFKVAEGKTAVLDVNFGTGFTGTVTAEDDATLTMVVTRTASGTKSFNGKFAGSGDIWLSGDGDANAVTLAGTGSEFTGTLHLFTDCYVVLGGQYATDTAQIFTAVDGKYANLALAGSDNSSSGLVVGAGFNKNGDTINAVNIGSLSGDSRSTIRGDWGESDNARKRYIAAHQDTDTEFAGRFLDNGNRSVGLIKYGTGELTLSGANASKAKLIIEEGSVLLTGSWDCANDGIAVGAAGTLAYSTNRTIASGDKLTFAAPEEGKPGATLLVKGGTLTMNGTREIPNVTLQDTGSLHVAGGSLTVSRQSSVAAGSTLSSASGTTFTLAGASLANSGEFALAGSVQMTGAATLTNAATATATISGSITAGTGTTVTNEGTMALGTAQLDGTLTNNSKLSLGSATVGNGTDAASLTSSGVINVTDSLTIAAGSTVRLTGSSAQLWLNQSAIAGEEGQYNIGLTNNGKLYLTAGSLYLGDGVYEDGEKYFLNSSGEIYDANGTCITAAVITAAGDDGYSFTSLLGGLNTGRNQSALATVVDGLICVTISGNTGNLVWAGDAGTWTGATSGTWQDSQTFHNNDNVTIGGAASIVTQTGAAEVNRLVVENAASLTVKGDMTLSTASVTGGSTLAIEGADAESTASALIHGDLTVKNSTVSVRNNATLDIDGNLNLAGAVTLEVKPGGSVIPSAGVIATEALTSLNLSGADISMANLGGATAFTKTGDGKLTLTNDLTLSGGLTINGGTVEMAAGKLIKGNMSVTIGENGVLVGHGNNTTTTCDSLKLHGNGTYVFYSSSFVNGGTWFHNQGSSDWTGTVRIIGSIGDSSNGFDANRFGTLDSYVELCGATGFIWNTINTNLKLLNTEDGSPAWVVTGGSGNNLAGTLSGTGDIKHTSNAFGITLNKDVSGWTGKMINTGGTGTLTLAKAGGQTLAAGVVVSGGTLNITTSAANSTNTISGDINVTGGTFNLNASTAGSTNTISGAIGVTGGVLNMTLGGTTTVSGAMSVSGTSNTDLNISVTGGTSTFTGAITSLDAATEYSDLNVTVSGGGTAVFHPTTRPTETIRFGTLSVQDGKLTFDNGQSLSVTTGIDMASAGTDEHARTLEIKGGTILTNHGTLSMNTDSLITVDKDSTLAGNRFSVVSLDKENDVTLQANAATSGGDNLGLANLVYTNADITFTGNSATTMAADLTGCVIRNSSTAPNGVLSLASPKVKGLYANNTVQITGTVSVSEATGIHIANGVKLFVAQGNSLTHDGIKYEGLTADAGLRRTGNNDSGWSAAADTYSAYYSSGVTVSDIRMTSTASKDIRAHLYHVEYVADGTGLTTKFLNSGNVLTSLTANGTVKIGADMIINGTATVNKLEWESASALTLQSDSTFNIISGRADGGLRIEAGATVTAGEVWFLGHALNNLSGDGLLINNTTSAVTLGGGERDITTINGNYEHAKSALIFTQNTSSTPTTINGSVTAGNSVTVQGGTTLKVSEGGSLNVTGSGALTVTGSNTTFTAEGDVKATKDVSVTSSANMTVKTTGTLDVGGTGVLKLGDSGVLNAEGTVKAGNGVAFSGTTGVINVKGDKVTIGGANATTAVELNADGASSAGTVNIAAGKTLNLINASASGIAFDTIAASEEAEAVATRGIVNITTGAAMYSATEDDSFVGKVSEAGPGNLKALMSDCSLKNTDVVIDASGATDSAALAMDVAGESFMGETFTLNILSGVTIYDNSTLKLAGMGNYSNIQLHWSVVEPPAGAAMPMPLLSGADGDTPSNTLAYEGGAVNLATMTGMNSGTVVNVWATYTVPEPTTGALSVLALAALAARRRRKH